MVSREPVLLIVAADRRELAGFTDLQPLDIGLRWSARGRLRGGPALFVATGVGEGNAVQAVERARARFEIEAMISTGFVGAVDPKLAVGKVLVAHSVRRKDPTLGYPVVLPVCPESAGAAGGVLLTIDHVAHTRAEKAALRVDGADAVDMEAAAVAGMAEAAGLPFYCVRVVSDDATTSFAIDFNRARRADGSISGWRVAAQAGLRPQRWKSLVELKRDADQAAMNLAEFLNRCRFPHPQQS